MGKTVPPIRLRAPEPEDLDVMMLFENDEDQWENGIATSLFPISAEAVYWAKYE